MGHSYGKGLKSYDGNISDEIGEGVEAQGCSVFILIFNWKPNCTFTPVSNSGLELLS